MISNLGDTVCVSSRINCKAKYANFTNDVAKVVKFGLLDDGEDSEQNLVGFVEISNLFTMQIAFFFGTDSFYKENLRQF